MDSRVIRVKTLNTVFDQFIRDDLEHAQGEWNLDRVKILTNMLKMKLESRAEYIDQSIIVTSNQEEKIEESVLDEIKILDLKASSATETLSSLNKLAVAINKLNKYVTSLKEIASNSPKKVDKPPQNITVNIVPQTPLKNQPVQVVNSLTPRRRTPFKDGNIQEVDDQFMQDLFNHPTVSGFLDHLTLDLIGDLMHDDGSSSHASTPVDPSENSEMNSTLVNISGGSLTTPKEVFRKPPIERLTPSANSSQGTNPVKNLMTELRTPEKSGRGGMSSPFSSPFVPCSSPCPEPVGESPVKIMIPDFNALTASPMQTQPMLSAAPRPVFIVQQPYSQQQNISQQAQPTPLNQFQFVNPSNVVSAHQSVLVGQPAGRKIAPKLSNSQSQSSLVTSPVKSRSTRKSMTTKKVTKVDPIEIEKAIKATHIVSQNVSVSKRKTSTIGSSGRSMKRFVPLNPQTTGANSSPDSHRLVIDDGKIVQKMTVQSSCDSMPTSTVTTTNSSGHTTILCSSLIVPNTTQNDVLNVNELCSTENMDFVKGLPKGRKLDEMLLSKVHNKNSKK